jgi:hypothetical protein
MGLPDRTGEPGDSEFGRPNIPSSVPNGSTPGGSEKYGTDRDFPFVDHVACFLWYVFSSLGSYKTDG